MEDHETKLYIRYPLKRVRKVTRIAYKNQKKGAQMEGDQGCPPLKKGD